MKPHRIILTPSPGVVFLRTTGAVIEMTPDEAFRLIDGIRSCVETALAASDGSALLELLAPSTR